MRFVEFQMAICSELSDNPDGLTWSQLRARLDLPYERPCPEWVRRLEVEHGLSRAPGSGRAYVWRLASRRSRARRGAR